MVTEQSRLYPKNKEISSVFISAPASSFPIVTPRAVRAMVQTADPFARFEFKFPPATINFDGMAAEYTELPRPLMNPAIDVKASRSYRISFEFLVAATVPNSKNISDLYDGIYFPVENELKTLEQMANRPIPIRFENFDILLTGNSWYIAEMTFNAVRYNEEGKITACQVSASFINYQQQRTRFISLPRISYKAKPKKSGKSSKTDPTDDGITVEEFYQGSYGKKSLGPFSAL